MGESIFLFGVEGYGGVCMHESGVVQELWQGIHRRTWASFSLNVLTDCASDIDWTNVRGEMIGSTKHV